MCTIRESYAMLGCVVMLAIETPRIFTVRFATKCTRFSIILPLFTLHSISLSTALIFSAIFLLLLKCLLKNHKKWDVFHAKSVLFYKKLHSLDACHPIMSVHLYYCAYGCFYMCMWLRCYLTVLYNSYVIGIYLLHLLARHILLTRLPLRKVNMCGSVRLVSVVSCLASCTASPLTFRISNPLLRV